MARYVAFLRAVNLGNRRVDMATACDVLAQLGLTEVSSFVNSGNLLFTSTGRTAALEKRIRAALEEQYGFEITTFVRTAAQVRTLAAEKPFGTIATGHTHFVLLPLRPLSRAEQQAAEALSNEQDEVVLVGRDLHWLIRDRSINTSLDGKTWKRALPDNPTTARNVTMVERLVRKL
ncbi:MAG TPA: DUF1697 domain-containing protein [Jatrophihabitans sp.]|nr:DUF1697 domain-containing protein [Jatrophihabitans sp.]